MSPSARRNDLKNAIKFGNHKGVSLHPKFYKELNTKDVENGFSLPIPLDKLMKLDGALACPMNIIAQHTISSTGEIVDKQRACHDLSFPCKPSNLSVNLRVEKSSLHNCMFGHCLLRTIHFIMTLRLKFPAQSIYIQKVDWKAAYRRIHTNWKTSIQCCSIYDDYALIPLRATFGGSPCPSEWSIISETATDLANMLLSNEDWDPTMLQSPHQPYIKPPRTLDEKLPFGTALPMMVDVPIDTPSKADVYIDDIITVSLASPMNDARASAAVPLSIHILGRPMSTNEPIQRDELMSIIKLQAEGQLEEYKTVLGWEINTRTLTIHIPTQKYKVWKDSINVLLHRRDSKHKELETLIGRLTHLSSVVPHILHFMNNLRSLCISAQKRGKVKLKQIHMDDLHLMLEFLNYTHAGVNMNMITHRRPTRIYFADACPAGIGGYNSIGIAWRWPLPTHLLNRATSNMLEHVASTIGPWLDIHLGNLPLFSCILSMSDSTTSAGWLRKSNFMDTDDTSLHMRQKAETSRTHAIRMMHNNIKEYSQWFPGDQNIIADSLSRDFTIPDDELTSLFHEKFSTQMHPSFKIVQLPQEIDSWLCAWLQQMPVSPQSLEEHHQSTLSHGDDGNTSSNPLICPMTSSYNPSNLTNAQQSCQHLANQFDEGSTPNKAFLDWVKTQSEMPSTMWHRPSSATTKPIPGLTVMENTQAFYATNIKDTRTKIRVRNTKKPYPVAY